MKSVAKHLLFGNYFYGLCAVALSIEASIIQGIPLLHILYYLLIFTATVFYYTSAYIHLNDYSSKNTRIKWYFENNKTIQKIQSALFFSIIILSISYLRKYIFIESPNELLIKIKSLGYTNLASQLSLLLLFPLTGILYYLNLRNIGWLKPFFISFTWAGIVSIYPLVFSSFERNEILHFNTVDILLFINYTMYILILCILFDIKDYSADYNKSVKTFVVKYGLRNTIFYICIPLCLLGLGSFVLYGVVHHYSLIKIGLNVIPFILMCWAIYSLKNRRNIFFYLFYIDGLMLVKALCGIIAYKYF